MQVQKSPHVISSKCCSQISRIGNLVNSYISLNHRTSSHTPYTFHDKYDLRGRYISSLQIKGGDYYHCVDENEMTAFKSARHSVGRLRNVSMKRSLMGSTVATPTSLHFPSSSILSPLPSLISPFDSSDVNTVSTSSGRALYTLPTEKQNSAINLRST